MHPLGADLPRTPALPNLVFTTSLAITTMAAVLTLALTIITKPCCSCAHRKNKNTHNIIYTI